MPGVYKDPDYMKHYKESNKERLKEYNIKYLKQYYVDNKYEMLKHQKEYYSKNIINQARYRKNRRIKALSIVSNGDIRCIHCGCDIIDILEINHKNGGGSKEYHSGNGSLMIRIINGNRTVDDLELRCKVCNALHDVEYRKGIHGFKITWDKIHI